MTSDRKIDLWCQIHKQWPTIAWLYYHFVHGCIYLQTAMNVALHQGSLLCCSLLKCADTLFHCTASICTFSTTIWCRKLNILKPHCTVLQTTESRRAMDPSIHKPNSLTVSTILVYLPREITPGRTVYTEAINFQVWLIKPFGANYWRYPPGGGGGGGGRE